MSSHWRMEESVTLVLASNQDLLTLSLITEGLRRIRRIRGRVEQHRCWTGRLPKYLKRLVVLIVPPKARVIL